MRTLKSPFRLDGGSIGSTSDVSIIAEQKIINCLTTSRYERVGLPQYGAGAFQLVLDNLDELTSRDFTVDAGQELAASVSGVTIVSMHVIPADEDGVASIDVSYRTPLSAASSVTLKLGPDDFLTEEST
jgi:hypothetical protein